MSGLLDGNLGESKALEESVVPSKEEVKEPSCDEGEEPEDDFPPGLTDDWED
jgi:hypothetical protein